MFVVGSPVNATRSASCPKPIRPRSASRNMAALPLVACRMTSSGESLVLVNQQLHFPGVVTVGKNTHITAHSESDPGFPRRLHARLLRSNFFRFGIDPFLPSAILQDRILGGNRWTKGDLVFFHQAEDFRRAFIAMLDRVDTTENRAAHSFGRGRVGGNRATGIMCGFDAAAISSCEKVVREGSPAPRAIIDVKLYPIGAFAHLLSGCPNKDSDRSRWPPLRLVEDRDRSKVSVHNFRWPQSRGSRQSFAGPERFPDLSPFLVPRRRSRLLRFPSREQW